MRTHTHIRMKQPFLRLRTVCLPLALLGPRTLRGWAEIVQLTVEKIKKKNGTIRLIMGQKIDRSNQSQTYAHTHNMCMRTHNTCARTHTTCAHAHLCTHTQHMRTHTKYTHNMCTHTQKERRPRRGGRGGGKPKRTRRGKQATPPTKTTNLSLQICVLAN